MYVTLCYGAGDDEGDDDDEDAEEKLPSCMDYVMHFLTIFWKVLFAFVPPTGKRNGLLALLTKYWRLTCITCRLRYDKRQNICVRTGHLFKL